MKKYEVVNLPANGDVPRHHFGEEFGLINITPDLPQHIQAVGFELGIPYFKEVGDTAKPAIAPALAIEAKK